MKFFGAIEFLDSPTREGRQTNPTDFETIGDWNASVVEYFTQEVNCQEYDGSEILINVYALAPGETEVTYFDINSDQLVSSKSIRNPYYV